MNEFEIKAINSALKQLNIVEIDTRFMDFHIKGSKERPYDLIIKYKYENEIYMAYTVYEELEELEYDKLQWVKNTISSQIKEIKRQITENKTKNKHALSEFITQQIEYCLIKQEIQLKNGQYDELSSEIHARVRELQKTIDNLSIYKTITKELKERLGIK